MAHCDGIKGRPSILSVSADQVMSLVFIPLIILVQLLPCSSTSERAFLIFSVPRFRPLVLLITADHVRKIRDRKQRTDIWKDFFVNRSIKKLESATCRRVRDFLL